MSDKTFIPGRNIHGEECKNCLRLGTLCGHHSGKKITLPRTSSSGEWVTIYLAALRKGYTKDAAAGLAGISNRTASLRASRDPEFAVQEEVAYNIGTSYYIDRAIVRIEDVENPADGLLRHMLATRGVSAKVQVEHSGPDGGPINLQSSVIPFDKLSRGLQMAIVRELEDLALQESQSEMVIDVTPERNELALASGPAFFEEDEA